MSCSAGPGAELVLCCSSSNSYILRAVPAANKSKEAASPPPGPTLAHTNSFPTTHILITRAAPRIYHQIYPARTGSLGSPTWQALSPNMLSHVTHMCDVLYHEHQRHSPPNRTRALREPLEAAFGNFTSLKLISLMNLWGPRQGPAHGLVKKRFIISLLKLVIFLFSSWTVRDVAWEKSTRITIWLNHLRVKWGRSTKRTKDDINHQLRP